MADDVDSGLFNITLSDSEDGDSGQATSGDTNGAARDRTGQTESEFQAVKTSYRPKVDNGEVSCFLPLSYLRPRLPRTASQARKKKSLVCWLTLTGAPQADMETH